VNPFLRASLAILSLSIAGAWPLNAFSAECETAKVHDEVRRWLTQIRDYEVRARISLEGQDVGSRITGKLPDRLRMRLEMVLPAGRLIQTVVFDGEYQWVESKHPSSTQVFKIALAGLTTPERPFDTAYYLMGTGLLNGEGFPETIADLLSVYDLKASCVDDFVALSGPIDVHAFAEYAIKRRSGGQKASVERFAKEFGHLRIELEPDGYVVSRYAMGPSEGELLFTVDFQEIRTNQGVAAEAFEYRPPAGVEPEDITEAVKNQGDAW